MPKPARILGGAMILAGVAALVVSLPAMTRQIRAENAGQDLPFFGTRSPAPEAIPFIDGQAVFAWGSSDVQTPVTLTLEENGAQLRVNYRGETHTLPITGPVDARLPGFARFRDDQIRLVVISEQRPRKTDTRIDSESVRDDRLILAARIERPLREGEDAMAPVVDRRAWRYELIEFMPADADPETPAIVAQEITYDDLPDWERTWQYAAALTVTPPLKFPKLKDPKGSNRGLDGVTWPFPVAASAILVGAVGAILLAGSFIRREPDETGAPTPPGTHPNA